MFSITKLIGHEYLVEGTDNNGTSDSTTINGRQWDEINLQLKRSSLEEDFDAKIQAFFAPLTEAAEQLVLEGQAEVDPLTTIVLNEGEEATPGQRREEINLTYGSMVLRAIVTGNDHRLRWHKGSLVIVADTDPGDDRQPVPADAPDLDDVVNTAQTQAQSAETDTF